MLKVPKELSRPGAEVNLDLIWHDGRYAVVLDGSSSLSGSESDVLDFTHAFMQGFERQASRGLELHECVNAAIDSLRGSFRPDNYQDGIVPSAAGVFLRETDDRVEVLSVADCSATILGKDGRVTRVCENSVGRFDAEALMKATSFCCMFGHGLADVVRRPRMRTILLANRRMMNVPGGYLALASNMRPLTAEDVARFDREDVACVLLCSDGFDVAADGFSSCDFDIDAAYDAMRRAERLDSSLERRPRFKVSDDASAMVILVQDDDL